MALKFAFCLLMVICGLCTITHAEGDLHEIVTNFARKLFRAVMNSSKNNENVIISPYAIQRIIMVALQAARGPLYAQMQRALEVECIGDVLADGLFKNYPEGFRYVDQIFHNVDTTLRIPYILIAKILFNVSPESIDLNNPRSVARQINSFVEKSLHGMIKKYFNTAEINNESSIYFINAVYYEGHWDTPFDKNSKRFGKFLNYGNIEVPVKHMYSVHFFNYAKLTDLEATILELPYRDSDEKMLILLPNKGANFRKVQEKIMKIDFPIILKRTKSTLVAVSMPPFWVEYRTDLSIILPSLGMESLFADDVDLSNGFDATPSKMVPRLYQKAFFEVNEDGSVVNVARSNKKKDSANINEIESKSPEKFFLVENPFLFFLHTNGTIHFVGSVQSIDSTEP